MHQGSYAYAPSRAKGMSVLPPKEEEVASFLLSLKHSKNRSVTPEPPSITSSGDDSKPRYHPSHHSHHPSAKASYSSTYHYPSYGYDIPQQLEQPSYLDPEQNPTQTAMTFPEHDIAWDRLLNGSTLVFLKDRDLVPDALFVAIAQMKPCRLTIADRVGCYKSREVGFVGMCCKHCGGQPGFGRYYPNSVRSLAQTTTSQTILKHIGSKCRFCPPHIRNAIQDLQRMQSVREGAVTGRPRYGSRKIFFQRVWNRLHDEVSKDEDSKNADDDSNQTPSDLDDESASLGCSVSTEPENDAFKLSNKRKGRFGPLPMTGKRVKVTSPHHRLSAD